MIKIYLEETCWEDVDWTNLVQDTYRQAAGSCGSDNIFGFHEIPGNSLLVEKLLAIEE